MTKVIRRWGDKYEECRKLSPFIRAWQTVIGTLNKLVHIWAYNDVAERQRIRAKAIELSAWPPDTHAEGMLL